jgi:hypothetical protein
MTISFPEIQGENLIVIDPFEIPLFRIDELSSKIIDIIDKYIPIFSLRKVGKCEYTSEYWILCSKSSFFLYFTNGTIFWGFSHFEFSSYSIPFSFMDIIFFFYSMEHQGLIIFFQITECGEFHGMIIEKNLYILYLSFYTFDSKSMITAESP